MALRSKLPKHREAYPHLNVLEAVAAMNRGHDVCVFTADDIRPFGVLSFGASADFSEAILLGEILGPPGIRPWYGPTRIRLAPNANPIDQERRAMICPGCTRRCGTLVWIGSWNCRGCDRLLDRRQAVGTATNVTEDLHRLRRRVAAGRREHEHQSSFDNDVEKLAELEEKSRDVGLRFATNAQRLRVSTEWMEASEFERRRRSRGFDVSLELRQYSKVAREDREPQKTATIPKTFAAGKERTLRFDFENPANCSNEDFTDDL